METRTAKAAATAAREEAREKAAEVQRWNANQAGSSNEAAEQPMKPPPIPAAPAHLQGCELAAGGTRDARRRQQAQAPQAAAKEHDGVYPILRDLGRDRESGHRTFTQQVIPYTVEI